MNQSERILASQLAQALLQTKVELAFYKKKSGLGDIPSVMHPDFVSLTQKFAPLTARLEKTIAQEETPEVDLEKLLQEVLTAVNTL